MGQAKLERDGELRDSRGRVMLMAAFAAFVVANLIHNRFGLDPAIVPAAVLAVLYVRRPRRGLLWGAAFVIAVPALLFLDWGALLDPADTLHFLNHLALLGAGALAIASVVLGMAAGRRAVRPS